jgi:adenosylhomocysteine nucleosidase
MKFKKSFKVVFAFLAGAVLIMAAENPPPLTAIISAFDEEVRLIDGRLQDKKVSSFLGLKFSQGKLKGRNVVLARTGVGKVNAAMTVAVLLDHFHPAEVIFTGIAGGINPDLQPGDVVIGEKVVQYDFGEYGTNGFRTNPTRNLADGKNPFFIQSDARLVTLARQAAVRTEFTAIATETKEHKVRCLTGVIASGDVFVSSPSRKNELRRQFQADAVEMEGAAIAQVCYQQRVPFIVIRSMSDNADERARIDVERFYQAAADNSAKLVMALVEMLNTSITQ